MTSSLQDRSENWTCDAPLTLADAASLATSVHGSLILADILRSCRQSLLEHVELDRLSLLQERSRGSTATIHSIDADPEGTLIGPRVIALEDSRLKQCATDHRMRVVEIEDESSQDSVERRHLLHRGTGVAVYSPLMLRGKCKGVLVLALPKGARFTGSHMSLLAYTTEHLALALENSDMHYLECRRGRQLSMVSEIAKQAVLAEDQADFQRAATELIRISLDYLEVQIWTVSPANKGILLAARAARASRSEEAGTPAMVEECVRLQRIAANNHSKFSPDGELGSELAVPLRLRGRLLGVLFVRSDRLDAFPSEDIDTLEGTASLIASAQDNLSAFEHAQESNEYMQAILESAKNLAVLSMNIHGAVMTSSAGSERIFGLSQKEIVGKEVLTLFTDPRFRREMAVYFANPEISTLERVRLAQREEEQIVYFNVSLQRVCNPEKKPVGFLCIVQNVTENVVLEQQLKSLSITDELTGLYNRRQFFFAITAEIERCHRFGRSVSLCFFDLDRFKEYNDTHGHLLGDQALRETSQLVLSLVRSNVDTCYRYGGDEFTIIMPETTIDKALGIAERIREKLGAHFQTEITASIGIASSAEAQEAEYLVEQADRAMYAAKAFGGNRTMLADQADTADMSNKPPLTA
ncbi:MAG: domain S-box/diguanylate cyclase domain protein [Acidobacteria bacterium]|jgi:diguanylate cyclase (GGDEF)-like protein/PAS domain S-box-containing protein|nr:domain S-box/diguanylate cyclase domain protein [Acidobacteriota bacterium]